MNQKILLTLAILGIIFLSGCVQQDRTQDDTTNNATTSNFTNNNADATTVVLTVGQKESYCTIQKISPGSVEALCDMPYPVYRSNISRTLQIGDNIGVGCEGVSEKLTRIDVDSNTVTFAKTVGEPTPGGCPICLSGNTLIDTPDGNIPVKELKIGMSVWTSDGLGHRQPAVIIKTGKAQAPPNHKMVHIILDNGRELFASPGHPTADGRTFGDIKSTDVVDNSHVKNIELVPYDQKYTYDLLPSGDTGFYWANGILVGSTLK